MFSCSESLRARSAGVRIPPKAAYCVTRRAACDSIKSGTPRIKYPRVANSPQAPLWCFSFLFSCSESLRARSAGVRIPPKAAYCVTRRAAQDSIEGGTPRIKFPRVANSPQAPLRCFSFLFSCSESLRARSAGVRIPPEAAYCVTRREVA